MDQVLKPGHFEIEQNVPNAEKLYKHWKLTLLNYLGVSNPDNTNEEVAATTDATARAYTAHSKFYALIASWQMYMKLSAM